MDTECLADEEEEALGDFVDALDEALAQTAKERGSKERGDCEEGEENGQEQQLSSNEKCNDINMETEEAQAQCGEANGGSMKQDGISTADGNVTGVDQIETAAAAPKSAEPEARRRVLPNTSSRSRAEGDAANDAPVSSDAGATCEANAKAAPNSKRKRESGGVSGEPAAKKSAKGSTPTKAKPKQEIGSASASSASSPTVSVQTWWTAHGFRTSPAK